MLTKEQSTWIKELLDNKQEYLKVTKNESNYEELKKPKKNIYKILKTAFLY